MALTTTSLINHIVENFDVEEDEIDATSSLFTSGILDSLTLIELVSYVEQEAGVKFGAFDINLANLDTVESIVKFAAQKKS